MKNKRGLEKNNCKNQYVLVLALFVVVFFMSFVSSICTITLDKEVYIAGETATLEMICTEQQEKSDAYQVNWTNETGYSLEEDIGTTPSTVSETFYQTYNIPSSWSNGDYLNVTLFGTDANDLEGTDFANVTVSGGGGENTLSITETTFGGGYLGLVSSVKATIKDENGKKISGGSCKISALSNDETQVLLEKSTNIIGGFIGLSDIFHPTRFRESTDYAYNIECFCGSIGSGNECIDEDGISVNNSIGTAKNFFTTKKYLELNTITDQMDYDLKNFMTICVNITNVDYPERIPLEIDYQVRCSVGDDNNDDIDRVLLFSDGESYDKRGISFNTTQMQCKKFLIPETREYEGTLSTCYASSNTWIIGEDGNRILDYPTTSPFFYINSTELNLHVDWTQIDNLTFNSIINLSSDSFNDWNGSNIGNIDIKLISPDETIDHNIIKIIQAVDLNNLLASKYINSISVTNISGDTIDSYLEFNDDGNLEIELREQYLGKTGWYNLTIVFNNYDERQAIALEGISNKTGTFHLDVNCPSTALINSNMNCSIFAQVEDSQIVEKEVDFTCYITDGVNQYSSLNFNQMINQTMFTIYRDFFVPASLEVNNGYVLQCHADYYNFGSRRDSFYDSFMAVTTYVEGGSGSSSNNKGSSFITGNAVGENGEDDSGIGIFEELNPFSPNKNVSYIFVASTILIIFILALVVLFVRTKNKSGISAKTLFYRVLFALIVFAILGGIVFGISKGYSYFRGFSSTASIISDPLVRDMVFVLFVALITIILFKAFGISGEIRFGQNYSSRKYYEDKKSAKLQQKINREILRDELRRHRKRK